MDQLTYAITRAGGVRALATELGITQPRISNWIARGNVPDGWLTVLSLKYPNPPTSTTPAATETAAQGVA